MTVRELREKYLEFFKSKGHDIFPSGSLIPYDVTGRLDESLLFNGAGMIQFKPYFRGAAEPANKRLTTAQKCVRTGDIEEVGDSSHLTFFEMLGNFSFGDYFKKEAIAFSWEFMFSPDWLALDPNKLVVTVFEEDDEAYEFWAEHWKRAGFEPQNKIIRLGEETNYWPAGSFSAGPPGPCGPNSEMFYWVDKSSPAPTGTYTKEDYLRDDKAGRWLEIWNDVFIQYEWRGHLRNPERPSDGYVKEELAALPFQSIDTGMGLDRTVVALGGLNSVYESDAFAPILARIQEISGKTYGTDPALDRAIRIIADHIRTAVFCIADGILPANNGRGYVLRRLIRRAVLQGQRTLKIDQAFFHKVFEGVRESMGGHYTELIERQDIILETLKNEEALFRRTVASGSDMLMSELERLKAGDTFSGSSAFHLYDTFGFPLEVTRELCAEAGVRVDEEGYESALKEAQERSRGASAMDTVYGGGDSQSATWLNEKVPTEFLGYASLFGEGKVVAIQGNQLALDRTPFYGASGGQNGDRGTLSIGEQTLLVTDTTKKDGVFWHKIDGHVGPELLGKRAEAEVAGAHRKPTQRNHTATHLLHAALRDTLGTHVTQAGSYVGPDRLRFDFTHGKAVTAQELATIEQIVNEAVLENTEVVTHVDIPIAEAKARGAMALFGEKYGDKVRMVEVGEFSRELCGGTHVRSTGEIGLFKIISEGSAASGVRRIEAVTGEGAYQWALGEHDRIRQAAASIKAAPGELVHAVTHLQEQLKDERRKREQAEAALVKGGASGGETSLEQIGSVQLWSQQFSDIDSKALAVSVDEKVGANPNLVAILAVVADGKIQFICKAGSAAVTAGAHVGKIAGEIAKRTGGGGGGRPDFATAGGKDPSKLHDAMAEVAGLLKSQLA